MQVTILGAGTAIPQDNHSPSGIYVKTAREHLLLDAGAGSLQRVQSIGAAWHQPRRYFLTHFFLDHCLGLASVLFAYRLPQLRSKKTRAVYGPPGLKKLYTQLNRAFSG